jgi:hypothetical protein
MGRDGYLILDSDLHMMEPDDLFVRWTTALINRAMGDIGHDPVRLVIMTRGRRITANLREQLL